MNKKYRIGLIFVFLALVTTLAVIYLSHHTVAVMQPRGPIALQERNLMLLAFGLMMIIVIPVFILTFYTVYKYRDGHHGKYKPEFDHSVTLESLWWLIPSVLISVLAVIGWHASQQLNPYRPIASKEPALNIEVIALDWKWLFIYPEQRVASVNYLVIPVNRPVVFYITADAPMNSFWIPQLSGQIYAMAGMSTRLNIMASTVGNYYGSSANISGRGFAGMHFDTHAVSASNFNQWLKLAGSSKLSLNKAQYASLDKPSINNPISYYKDPQPNLFVNVVEKYMPTGPSTGSMSGMEM